VKPFTRSIVDLFDGKKRYLIPLYQRQYAWPIAQLELLWEDIERAVDRINTDRTTLTPHFMGAIVISQIKTFGKQVQAYEIIDGQQRLTTFQILLSALRDVANEFGSAYGSEIQEYLLNGGVMDSPQVERYKLWPSLTDRRAFVALIDPAADPSEIEAASIDEANYVRRSTEAHAYFLRRIREQVLPDGGDYEEHRLEGLFEALKEGLAVVSIELEGGDDPQTIFETLNSRGVELTPGDLMRNFIFQRAKGLGQSSGSLNIDKLYATHWLPLDGSFWQTQASRGRLFRPRLVWLLTDHLSMHLADLVSADGLFDVYRKWVLTQQPFASTEEELKSISATAAIERRLFEQSKDDALGQFGKFAEAFDVSTAMPLVIYLANAIADEKALADALGSLKSYILRRDVCGLTTKNYNRFFVGTIDRLRKAEGDISANLREYLSARTSDIDRWPDDAEFRNGWLGRDQYKNARQPRLRLIFEGIEQRKRSLLNENIEIHSTLTIEHIMPQSWRDNWPVPPAEGEINILGAVDNEIARSMCINKMGNLTLLTHSLNASVSNGPFDVKMPAVRAHSSLALNRELTAYQVWDEEAVAERGMALLAIAQVVWPAPDRAEGSLPANTTAGTALSVGLPPVGTKCSFRYADKTWNGQIVAGGLQIDGLDGLASTFTAASRMVTATSRNGWMDWRLRLPGAIGDILADEWRQQLVAS
jgi:Protein of unknown function DUF262/Protein of unknown function (DUF1524)